VRVAKNYPNRVARAWLESISNDLQQNGSLRREATLLSTMKSTARVGAALARDRGRVNSLAGRDIRSLDCCQ
jgi:hypothetical protein